MATAIADMATAIADMVTATMDPSVEVVKTLTKHPPPL